MSLITTALDTLITRDPCLAEVMYKGASEDEIYKSCVDMKDAGISKYPDRIVTHNVAGLGPMASRTETGVIQMDIPGPADTKETVYSKFGLGVEFTEDFSEDVMYGVQSEIIADVGRSYGLTRNIQVGQLYDNAFLTTLYTSGDGKAILATDHTAYMGGPGRANCPAIDQPLSYEGVQTLCTLMRRQTDDRGNPRPAIMAGQSIQVTIPPEMEFDTDKILDAGSAYEPTTNNNAINVLKKYRWQVVINPYFTSTSNWFLSDPSDKGLWLVDKQPLQRDYYIRDETKGAVYDGRGKWGIHIKTWEKIYGSKG
jgi:hypothetical protein